MTRREYKPKEYKALVAKLLSENHEICRIKGLPNTFYRSAQGVEVLSNFDYVFNSFVNEFPLSHLMSHEQVEFTFKVLLQQQLDSYWYSGFKTYSTNLEIYNDDDLVCFKDVDTKFQYLPLEDGKYKTSLLKRLMLKITNSPLKYSTGVFLPYAPYPMFNFLNKICQDLDTSLVVTNVIRSIEYQERLLKQGHITPYESSHLYGYSVDIDQKWYKKNDPQKHRQIVNYLTKLEDDGQVNFVDYGHIWHICLSPCFLSLYFN
ncbi:hypothetical protein EW093_14930 [Thiospirochaeta perfilievii]|uniref:Uncharacterized protein n=1 Tax=Thiospirochaeta perfilievii TaxID=252967 RepID=A0A5C1QCU0_9SPIO|nr:DUF5715 family protein [Thiospirochaeta perfilievii]QEN05933.1 hypothetical protein EW093_14930 [Thiospirochaeta perfilievii]